jgi:hypothetical protein
MEISARRQCESNNSVKHWEWMFPADVTLYTTEMPKINTMEKYGLHLGYKFETCIFCKDGSDVLERYDTWEEAIAGHMKHTKDNNLRFIGEVFIPEMGRTSIP